MKRDQIARRASGVYKITDPSGACYIGSSVNIWKRWLGHQTMLRCGNHRSKSLQIAKDSYGLESLRFEILLICSKSQLLFYEQRALDEYKPTHNSSPTAGSSKGVVASEETRAKLASAKLGKRRGPMSPETRAKIAARAKERYLSPEYREKSAASMRGIPKSDEHRAKLSALNAGKTLSPEHRAKIGASNRAARSKTSNGN
jgi:group I intron endonuclease